MKKLFLIGLLFFVALWIWLCLAEEASAQNRSVVLKDSAFTYLNGISDIDTFMVSFPIIEKAEPNWIVMDTTRAGYTKITPPKTPPMISGTFALWLGRSNVSGAADSFKVYYKPTHPFRGTASKNDSTFVIGGTSTFGNIVDGYSYAITLSQPCYGFHLIVRHGDLTGTPVTKVSAAITISQ